NDISLTRSALPWFLETCRFTHPNQLPMEVFHTSLRRCQHCSSVERESPRAGP
ncbi:hypothetical protein COCVIDRAFT_87842, partial [Bipolaris victoriae FI3]